MIKIIKAIETYQLQLKKVNKYFNKYFEDNWNNMKNTWKGINNFLSEVRRTFSINDITISNPCDIANTFNNYFTFIAKKQMKTSNILINTILII